MPATPIRRAAAIRSIKEHGSASGISLHFKPLYHAPLLPRRAFGEFHSGDRDFTLAFMISPSQPVEPPVIAEITSGSAADAAGVQVGDVIQSVDGVPVAQFPDLQRIVSSSEGRQLRLGILRNGESLEILAAPRATEFTDPAGTRNTAFRLGIVPRYEPLPFHSVRSGRGPDLVDHSAHRGISPRSRDRTRQQQRLSGPLGIAKAAGDWAAAGFVALLNLTAFISVAIGFANLLADSRARRGHLLYYAFEAVLGAVGRTYARGGFRSVWPGCYA